MSVSAHRALRTPRPRRWRAASAVLAASALTLASAGIAMADTATVDGDTVKTAGANVQYSGTSTTNPANHACAERGAAAGGAVVISYDNSGNPKHFTAGENLTVAITGGTTGITATRTTPVDVNNAVITPKIPGTWNATGQSYTIGLSTVVATSVPVGTYTVTVTITGQTSGVVRDDTYDVTVDVSCPIDSLITDTDDDGVADADDNCPDDANADQADADNDGVGDVCDDNAFAPELGSAAADPAAGLEGSAQSTSGSFTDGDGNNTLTITKVSGAGTLTDNGDGSWSWAYTPADEGSGTVQVQASDGDLTHDVATDSFDWSASNVAPTVAAPAFGSTSVDCRGSVTLGGISFSDPGVNDDPWTVSIDWGDGSTPDTFSTNDQGLQTPDPTPSHTYVTPDTYTATVTVSDEDGGVSDPVESSNSVTVNQTYAVDFLPPFDDSSPSSLIVNKMKNGRVVPVKMTIYDECAQSAVTNPNTVVTIAVPRTDVSGGTPSDPVETYADAGLSSGGTNAFRWSTDGFWIYNLDSKALGLVTNTVYRVDAYVGASPARTKATRDTWAILQPVK
jgi:hypothetical protein